MRRDELNLPDPPPYDRPGDSWKCGDSNDCCPNGPSRNGKCPLADACQPKRTWHGRRRIAAFGLVGCAALAALVTFIPSAAPTVFKPGQLSNPHKQILASTLTSERCTACHRSASISPNAWFDSGGEGHRDISQTDRCLDCHHKTIRPDVAKLAHNLPARIREKIRSRIQLTSASASSNSWHDRLPGPAIDQENVECSACHREHRGSEADLLAVSDAQCQTCHSDRFGKFATSHPEWNQWPYGRGGDIAFDHQSHMTKHFPQTIQNGLTREFKCTACHKVTGNKELSRSVSYEVGCKSCHDEALKNQASKGIELVTLPLLPEKSAVAAGGWPAAAVGMMDGSVTPLTELLMRSDAAATTALRDVPDRNYGRLSPLSPAVDSIVPVAKGHRKLLEELAIEGHPAFLRRAAKAGVSPKSLLAIIRNLPPQLIYETYQSWFGSQNLPLSKQTNLADSGVIRLVDFAEQIKQQRKEESDDPAEMHSILLPLDEDDDDDWLVGPRIAQKRPQTSKIIKNLDSASDEELLGGQITLPKLPGPKTINKPQAPTKKPPVFKDPGSLLQVTPERDPLGLPPRKKLPKTEKPPAPEDLLTDEEILGGSELLKDQESMLLPPQSSDFMADDLTNDGLLDEEPLGKDSLLQDPLLNDPLLEDPLLSDPLLDDPLAQDPLSLESDPLAITPEPSSKAAAKRFNPTEMLPGGGWYRDDLKMSIGYRASGHSDPVLRAAIEMVRELPASDPVRQRLLATQSVAACISCHTAATRTNPSWTGNQLVGDRSQFTKFAHGPHLNVAGLMNCVHCHRVNEDDSQNPISLAAFSKKTNPHKGNPHEFLPMKRAACAACHTTQAAGDSCVQCHRYHIE